MDTSSAAKEMKVKLPTKLCVELHARKILRGISMQETVAAALTEYFREHPVAVLEGAEAFVTAE